MFFADVLINKKIQSLDRTFLYAVPPHLLTKVRVGTAVRVPFGKGSSSGLVVAIHREAGDIEAKPIERVLHADFIFPSDLLELASYVADYFLNTTIAVIRAMLPQGVNVFGRLRGAKTETILVGQSFSPLLRGPKQREVMDYLAEHGEVNQRQAIEELGFSMSAITALVQKGLLRREPRPVSRYSYRGRSFASSSLPSLTEEQRQVLDAIHTQFSREAKPFLLRGVTGSGKTELYLRLVGETLAAGKQSIVLLPEIALTPQFIAVFEERFAGKIVLMHSRLAEGERRDAWYAVNDGSAQVILGTRSAVFAPCRQLGLVIIDEEHEDSYEQSNAPRFHTRVVAEKRAAMTGALLLLASATPALESYEKAQRGTYYLLEMDHRVGHAPLPAVTIVDMRRELQEGWSQVLSRPLLAAIEDNLARGDQTMLFLNRRGFNTFVSCRDCGFVYRCPHCDVTMVYYRDQQRLRCNRCNYEEMVADRCPQCHSRRIRYFGLGTEGLLNIVRKRFPQAQIDRLDSDSTRRKGQFDDVYRRMQSGETDILVGTQMIAKGWDFPRVTLIGVVAADLLLNFPDFRSTERTFQSITQVAGRSGRGEAAGRVFLQTYRPDEPVIRFGGNQDYRAFFAWERQKRATYGYPPFSHLICIIFTLPKGNEEALLTLDRAAARLRMVLPKFGDLLGPAPAVYRYGPSQERWLLTLVGPDLDAMRAAVKEAMQKVAIEKVLDHKIYWQVEIDPQHTI